jgi:hypothetical protein
MIARRARRRVVTIILLIVGLAIIGITTPARASELAQLPTVSIPTVTGTPMGPYIIVNTDQDQINVRALPDPLSTKVGVLLAGQKVAAKGRVGQWVWIDYPGIPGDRGWVYAPLVTIYGGELPIVEPPPTITPLYTPTIDPTLAAQFIITVAPTRLPTFTAPPPLVIPTFPPESGGPIGTGKLPMGMVIVGIGAIGIFLALLSLIRGR